MNLVTCLTEYNPSLLRSKHLHLETRTLVRPHAMFAGSSLSSLSSLSELSSLPEESSKVPVELAIAGVSCLEGPFASKPDLEAVKYLKDTSNHYHASWMAL